MLWAGDKKTFPPSDFSSLKKGKPHHTSGLSFGLCPDVCQGTVDYDKKGLYLMLRVG